jgi:hypothetical protein
LSRQCSRRVLHRPGAPSRHRGSCAAVARLPGPRRPARGSFSSGQQDLAAGAVDADARPRSSARARRAAAAVRRVPGPRSRPAARRLGQDAVEQHAPARGDEDAARPRPPPGRRRRRRGRARRASARRRPARPVRCGAPPSAVPARARRPHCRARRRGRRWRRGRGSRSPRRGSAGPPDRVPGTPPVNPWDRRAGHLGPRRGMSPSDPGDGAVLSVAAATVAP